MQSSLCLGQQRLSVFLLSCPRVVNHDLTRSGQRGEHIETKRKDKRTKIDHMWACTSFDVSIDKDSTCYNLDNRCDPVHYSYIAGVCAQYTNIHAYIPILIFPLNLDMFNTYRKRALHLHTPAAAIIEKCTWQDIRSQFIFDKELNWSFQLSRKPINNWLMERCWF